MPNLQDVLALLGYPLVTVNPSDAPALMPLSGGTSTGLVAGPAFQITPTVTVATLPKCNAATAGMHRAVSDGLQSIGGNFGTPVTGGGTQNLPVYCDGTSWKIG